MRSFRFALRPSSARRLPQRTHVSTMFLMTSCMRQSWTGRCRESKIGLWIAVDTFGNAGPKPRACRSALWFIGSTLSYKLCETFLDDPYFVLELPNRRTQVEHAAVS